MKSNLFIDLAIVVTVVSLVILCVTFFSIATNTHTDAIMQSAQNYEECVKRESGFTPIQFKTLTGSEFGICN